VEEIIAAVGDPRSFAEVVFCGYGEPLIRLDTVKTVAGWLKQQGASVRVNTNGLASLWHGRNILPELKGLVDAISISLNAENAEKYQRICHPQLGEESYSALLEFIKESKKYIPKVQVTVVAVSEIDIESCRKIAEDLDVQFKVRNYAPEKY